MVDLKKTFGQSSFGRSFQAIYSVILDRGTVWGPWGSRGIGLHAAFLVDCEACSDALSLFPDSLRSARLPIPCRLTQGSGPYRMSSRGIGMVVTAALVVGRGLLPVVSQQRQVAGRDERGSIRRLQDRVRVRNDQ